jgi:SAM-dependent methyltransferase
MKYQDIWVNGKCISKGKRDSASRYEIIRTYCTVFNKPFTVLDIGANMCYFGLRLIEDFNCNVVAFEFDQFQDRLKYIKQNKTDKLLFINHKLHLNDLKIMNTCAHFDLILALSVLHHVSEPINLWIQELRKLADNVIIEFALEDSKRVAIRKNYTIPNDSVILGYGDSHLKENFKRPIVLLKGNNEKTIGNRID